MSFFSYYNVNWARQGITEFNYSSKCVIESSNRIPVNLMHFTTHMH